MKPSLLSASFALLLATASFAATSPEPFAAVDGALEQVVAWNGTGDHRALDQVADAVVASLDRPDQREMLEYRLIAALQTARTRMAKDFLCRQLRTIGSDRAVPALAALLTDPESAAMARYALERIGGKRVVAALEAALDQTEGALRIGCINSLGNLGAFHLNGPLPPLLKSAHPAVGAAVADALGKLRQPAPAIKLLEAVRGEDTPPELRRHVDNALLRIANTLLAQGDRRAAARIYAHYYAPDQPPHLRIGALQGLIRSGDEDALDLLTRAIEDPDPALQANAIALVREPGPTAVTRRLAERLPRLAPGAQALLIDALGDRGDRAAAPAVKAAVRSDEEPVRLAALRALGALGDAGSVRVLLAAAATQGAAQKAARASLGRLSAEGVNAALLTATQRGPANRRAEAVRALADRHAVDAVPALLSLARDPETAVRTAALDALGALAGAPQLPALLNILLHPAAPQDRPPARQAVEAVFRRMEETPVRAGALLEALSRAPADAEPELLPLFPLAATPETLTAVRTRLTKPATHEAALRALAEWPDPAAAPDLLAQARQAASPALKSVALRGFVRLAGLSNDPTGMYQQAIALSRSTQDRRMILAGLGDADNPAALELVQPYLDDPEVRAEAALALVQIADRVRVQDGARAKAALLAVQAAQPGSRAAKRARKVINEMEKYDGYLLLWQAAGPYQVKGKEAKAVFDTAFPPEQPGMPGVTWQRLKKGVHAWDLNLEDQFGSLNQVAAYLRTWVWAPAAGKARLEVSSDDAVKAWLNGKLVHANLATRGLAPAQDLVPVTLQKGWNELMLKIVDKDGGWAAACRVRRPDGAALDGLKVSSSPRP